MTNSIAKFSTVKRKETVWKKGNQGQEYSKVEWRTIISCDCGWEGTDTVGHRLDHLEGKIR